MQLAEVRPLIGWSYVLQAQSDGAAERVVAAFTFKPRLGVPLRTHRLVSKLPGKLFNLDVPLLGRGGVTHQAHVFSTLGPHFVCGLQIHLIG